MRLALAILLVCASGCGGVRDCKDGTLLLTLDFPAQLTAFDTVEVDVAIDGGVAKVSTFPVTGPLASGTVEIDFPGGWPLGHTLVLEARALASGTAVAAGGGSVAAVDACEAHTLTLE